MNESSPTEHAAKPGRATFWWTVGFAFLALQIFGPPVEHLLLGWIYFPMRVLPKVTVDKTMLLLGLVAVAVFLGVLHVTLQWFVRQSNPEQLWSFVSSERVTGLILLGFVAGVAIVGATHQFVWVLSGKPGTTTDREAVRQQFLPSLANAVASAREAARTTQSRNSLRQVGLAVHNLHDVFHVLPPGGTMTADGRLLHGWPIFLGNYASFSSNGVDFSVPWNEAPNDRLFRCGLQEFINPSVSGPYFDQDGFGLCHYAANRHVLTLQTIETMPTSIGYWDPAKHAKGTLSLADISDGASNTILMGTAAGNFRPWGHPTNLRNPGDGINKSADGFGGPWKAAQLLFCDGQVRMVNEKVDPEVLKSMGMPADGRRVDVDF